MTFRELLSNRIDMTGVKNIMRKIKLNMNAQEELVKLIYKENEYSARDKTLKRLTL